MTGRFRKIDPTNIEFVGGGGIFCNNENKEALKSLLEEFFGKPNHTGFNPNETTWMYILEYEGYYITVYDYLDMWSLGFLETPDTIIDYGKMTAFARMLYNFLLDNLYPSRTKDISKKKSKYKPKTKIKVKK